MKELLNEIDGLQDGSLMAHADGSVNKVNKETREKIEDILNSYILDDLPSGMVSELSTLIQAERKEAVEGLLKWFEGKKVRECFKELNDKYTGEEYIETTEGYHYLQGFVEEYLESDGK